MTLRIPPRRIQHPDHGTPEYRGDSFRAAIEAKHAGIRWGDVNFLKTLDGVIVAEHWPCPLAHGFHDPTGRYGPGIRVSQIPWDDLRLFRTRDPVPYRIRRAEDIIPYWLAHGVAIEFEAKTSAFTVADYEHVRAIAENSRSPLPDRLDHRLQVKTMFTLPPRPWNRLVRAHAAGLTTIALCHRPRIEVPRSARPSIDFYRGHEPIYV